MAGETVWNQAGIKSKPGEASTKKGERNEGTNHREWIDSDGAELRL